MYRRGTLRPIWPDDVPVPAFARMVCTRCGIIGATACSLIGKPPPRYDPVMQTVFQHYFLTELSMLAICRCRSIVSMAVAIFANDFSARPLASQ
jgi:hypothetical protein